MKRKRKKFMAAIMAAVLTLGMSVTAFADTTPATIDTSKKGSLTLHKYDYTAADKDGVTSNTYVSTGETNSAAEEAYKSYAIEGVEFTALKVADIETYTTTSGGTAMVEVVYSLDASVATILGLDTNDAIVISSTNYWTSTQITEALAAKLKSDADTNVTTTTDALKNYVVNSTDSQSDITDATGAASWSNLDLGLYLVVETKVPDQVNTTTDPFLVSVPMTASNSTDWNYDVVAYPKNQTDFPDVTKTVREKTDANDGAYADTVSSSIGDVLEYRIVSNLPAITSEATYLTQYTYTDTLSKGQTFNDDIVVAFYSSTVDPNAASLGTPTVTLKAASQTEPNPDYTVVSSTDSDGNTVITIALTDAGLAKINAGASASTSSNGDYSCMVISYSATLNEDAVLGDSGNENDVKLTYARTNDTYTKTLEDKTKVYTFGLDILKKFSDGKVSDASGIEFTLQNSDGKYITAKKNSDGNYTVTGLTDTSASTSGDDNTVFSPAANGSLYIAGLEAGTYTLTETKTLSGYTLLKEPITIVISSKAETITASTLEYTVDANGVKVLTATEVLENANPANSSATVNGETATMSEDKTVAASENAAVELEITNTPGFALPSTGGAGIWMLTILGVLVGGLGIYFMVSKRHKEG